MADGFSRRRFLQSGVALGAGLALGPGGWGCSRIRHGVQELPDLAVVQGALPARNCQAAIDALGGMTRFVHPGNRVVIKPNPVGNSRPEQAIHTHPDMVEVVVRECWEAGAAEVIVTSHDSRRNIKTNGTAAAVERAGGELRVLETMDQFREIPVPRGRLLGSEFIATDVLEADVFINMPIAKHHAGAEVTFAMKNLMGINWDRIRFHQTDLQRGIAELAGTVVHSLILMDANHVLLTNGPVGPGEVLAAQTVIAGTDPVAVDAYTMRFFERAPEEIGHIRLAHELGIGEIDLANLTIREYQA